jgi:hypothetical protein
LANAASGNKTTTVKASDIAGSTSTDLFPPSSSK